MKWFSHLRTILHHKRLVMGYCFKVSLYRQGIMHDFSKFSPVEFFNGARYFQGFQSPNNLERKVKGYSAAWLHHKGRNKHHLEYWIDYAQDEAHKMAGMEMPVNYVVEMFCDRVAASRTYRKEQYQNSDPYDYYMNSKDIYLLNPKTRLLLEKMLTSLKDNGEEKTFEMINKEILKK